MESETFFAWYPYLTTEDGWVWWDWVHVDTFIYYDGAAETKSWRAIF